MKFRETVREILWFELLGKAAVLGLVNPAFRECAPPLRSIFRLHRKN